MLGHVTSARHAAVATLLALAAMWPGVYAAVTYWAATPYERALRNAWCGDGSDWVAVLGHCGACWMGVAMIGTAAIVVLGAARTRLNHQPYQHEPRWAMIGMPS